MTMTSKERMLTALARGKPDRLPVTIHQWQAFHLQKFMGGMGQIEAFRATGLDASVMPSGVLSGAPRETWQYRCDDEGEREGQHYRRHFALTPAGELTWVTASNEYTTFRTEYPVKNAADLAVFLRYQPTAHLDRQNLARWYEQTGDSGIVRGYVACFGQPGPWQEFCELVGTQEAIFWAMDQPELVHHFLQQDTRRKVEFVHREMAGARYDLVEHGGGAASSTVISPAMFDEFCKPYDRQIIAALHEEGFPVVYHTCGGMMAILEHIPGNGCNASETLSPPGVGGDIQDQQRQTVKEVLGAKVALIGGVDQGRILSEGTAAEIRAHVQDCFETYGRGGGYICSASDHFFHTPAANLIILAEAGRDCRY